MFQYHSLSPHMLRKSALTELTDRILNSTDSSASIAKIWKSIENLQKSHKHRKDSQCKIFPHLIGTDHLEGDWLLESLVHNFEYMHHSIDTRVI